MAGIHNILLETYKATIPVTQTPYTLSVAYSTASMDALIGNSGYQLDQGASDGTTMILGGYGGGIAQGAIVKSTTGGTTWTNISTAWDAAAAPVGYGGIVYPISIIAGPTGHFVTIDNSGYATYTTDSGVTWTRSAAMISPTTGITLDTTSHAATYGGGLYMAAGRGSFYTSPTGAVWTTSSTFSTTGQVQVDMAYGNGIIVIASRLTNNTGTFIQTSSNGGATWTAVTVLPALSGGAQRCLFSSVNNTFVVIPNYPGVPWYSTDGINWSQSTASPQFNGIQMSMFDGKRFVFLRSADTILHTSHDSINWDDQSQPSLRVNHTIGVAIPGTAIIAGAGADILKYTPS